MLLTRGPAALAAPPGPFDLDAAVAPAEAVTFSGEYRLRYEHLAAPFRPGASGSDQLAAERISLALEVDPGGTWHGRAELLDSRAWLADEGSPLGTDDVNVLEPLEAWVGWRAGERGRLASGGSFDLRVGRMALNLGSRRYLSRNGFRNTINGFTAVRALWESPDGRLLDVFYALPLERRPSSRARLDALDAQLDDADLDRRLFGVMLTQPLTGPIFDRLEFYALVLDEDDDADPAGVRTRNRDLNTVSLRMLRSPDDGRWDYGFEAALQIGTSRASSAPGDRRDLVHEAGTIHLHAGRTLAAGRWRAVFQFDWASGDRDPTDGRNERFDPLFGSRGFEFAQTGIYGPISRGNLVTPGLRLEGRRLGTRGRLGMSAIWRPTWLDSARDALVGAGLADPTGGAGDFVGHVLEVRAQRPVLGGRIRLDAGVGLLVHGEFLREAPTAPREGDTRYAYLQMTLPF